jgi:hypothetical protein
VDVSTLALVPFLYFCAVMIMETYLVLCDALLVEDRY